MKALLIVALVLQGLGILTKIGFMFLSHSVKGREDEVTGVEEKQVYTVHGAAGYCKYSLICSIFFEVVFALILAGI